MRPPLARMRATLVCLACIAALAVVPPAVAATSQQVNTRNTALETAILAKIDSLRADSGLGRLIVAPRLTKAASAHGFSMAENGFFSHSSLDGASAPARILSSLGRSSGGAWAVGEILAWTLTPAKADDVIAQWLGSPVHESVILGRWTHVGIAAVRAPGAPGVFGGRDVTIVVVDFARRAG